MNKVITFSSAYTIVPTYECFNRCSYCNFRSDPDLTSWLNVTKAQQKLTELQKQGICEILILSGEVHPLSPKREAWLQLIYDLAQLALSMGFLPHTNCGPLSFAEMEKLKQVNVSMGLMLEQLTPKLLETVHRHAPSKVPAIRLQQLEWAGELGIPFTTGILLGIGETEADCWDSLEAIATIQQKWGHIQEVILQPHSPGQNQTFAAPGFNLHRLPEVIAKAHTILSNNITLQIPPNLLSGSNFLLECLDAGARDLGGIGPKDEVNPDYPHLTPEFIANIIEPAGWQLIPRLPVYPQYYDRLPPQLQVAVKSFSVQKFTIARA